MIATSGFEIVDVRLKLQVTEENNTWKRSRGVFSRFLPGNKCVEEEMYPVVNSIYVCVAQNVGIGIHSKRRKG